MKGAFAHFRRSLGAANAGRPEMSRLRKPLSGQILMALQGNAIMITMTLTPLIIPIFIFGGERHFVHCFGQSQGKVTVDSK